MFTYRQSPSKEIRRAEHEYMNIHPPIIALGTALIYVYIRNIFNKSVLKC